MLPCEFSKIVLTNLILQYLETFQIESSVNSSLAEDVTENNLKIAVKIEEWYNKVEAESHSKVAFIVMSSPI